MWHPIFMIKFFQLTYTQHSEGVYFGMYDPRFISCMVYIAVVKYGSSKVLYTLYHKITTILLLLVILLLQLLNHYFTFPFYFYYRYTIDTHTELG